MIKTWQQRQAETGIGSIEAKDDEIRDLRQAIEQAEGQEPIGSVTSSPWRGLENIEWQQQRDIPEGTHMLYLHPPAPAQPSPLQDPKDKPWQRDHYPQCKTCNKSFYVGETCGWVCDGVNMYSPLEAHIKGETK